jgi:hypothetical protein
VLVWQVGPVVELVDQWLSRVTIGHQKVNEWSMVLSEPAFVISDPVYLHYVVFKQFGDIFSDLLGPRYGLYILLEL